MFFWPGGSRVDDASPALQGEKAHDDDARLACALTVMTCIHQSIRHKKNMITQIHARLDRRFSEGQCMSSFYILLSMLFFPRKKEN